MRPCLTPRAQPGPMFRFAWQALRADDAGQGRELGPLLALPPLIGLMVNPGVPVATESVFSRMNITPGSATGFGGHPDLYPGMPMDTLIAALRKGRNDMEGGGLPACARHRRRAVDSLGRAGLPPRPHVRFRCHLLCAVQGLPLGRARQEGNSSRASILVGKGLRLELNRLFANCD